jgi:ABC-type antimicrobial peptide transport system permease subunit
MLIPQEEESIRNVVNFVETFNEKYDYDSYLVKNGVPHASIWWRTESLSDIHYEVYDLQSTSLSYLIGGILLAVTALAIFILYLMKIKKKQWNFRLVENQVEDEKGVVKIVSVQCLFVALISYVISVLVMNLIVLIINLGIKASSSVDIFLIYTPIGSYFLMLGVSLLMAVLAFIFVWIFYLREKKLDQARTQE